jgi:hypothetical protein
MQPWELGNKTDSTRLRKINEKTQLDAETKELEIFSGDTK